AFDHRVSPFIDPPPLSPPHVGGGGAQGTLRLYGFIGPTFEVCTVPGAKRVGDGACAAVPGLFIDPPPLSPPHVGGGGVQGRYVCTSLVLISYYRISARRY